MSERPHVPPDDDARLAAMWREHSAELPPAHLDAAILAAAHREARSKPRAAGDDDALAEAREPSRWWWGLAAAATIGAVAFGVIQLAPPHPTDVPGTVSDVPPQASPPAAKREDAAPVPEPEPVPVPAPVPSPPPRQAAAPRAFSATPDAAPLQKMETEQRGREQVAADTHGERKEAPSAPAPSADRRAFGIAPSAEVQRKATEAVLTPAEYIERIRRALDEARPEDARRELAAFRAAHADADERLPESLRSWAAAIPHEAARR